jgi:4-hydroxy-tetrahydrodipicolinate synthase
MIAASALRGCFPALITPMRRQARGVVIDWEAFSLLLRQVCEAGAAGVVIGGTTGQSAALGPEEHLRLVVEGTATLRELAASLGRPLLAIAGCGANDTARALEMSRRVLDHARPDALLHVTGWYNNPPQEGLFRHFSAVADLAAERDVGVILYNVPSRTASNLRVETVVRLARHPAVLGIKEASGDLVQVAAVLAGTDREGFAVLSGEDHLVAEIIRFGGSGVISASANRWPREFAVLCDLALASRHEEAAALQEALLPCVRAVFAAKNPIPLHHMLGFALRLPLVDLDEIEEPLRHEALAKVAAALDPGSRS